MRQGVPGRQAGKQARLKRVRVAVAGCGRWGQNYLRLLGQQEGASLVGACDTSARSLARATATAPSVPRYPDLAGMLKACSPDAVIVATPSSTHFRVASAALSAGADVLVEKPMTTSLKDARSLTQLARRRGRVLMAGHVYHYHAAWQALRKAVKGGRLGRVRYLDSKRTNFGPVRDDVSVIWDLAPHDVSMLMELAGGRPLAVNATGRCILRKGSPDVVFGTLHFRRGGVVGHLQVSWLAPRKVRELAVVGSRGMAVFNDTNPQEPLRFYNRDVTRDKEYGDYGEFHLVLRDGAINIPHVRMEEPLKAELAHFIECVRRRARPATGGVHGAEVVAVLEAMERSLKLGGARVRVGK